MSENLSKLHRSLDSYYSSNYLSSWCSSVKIEWTEFLDRAFSGTVPSILGSGDKKVILDIGCGPSISNIISASKYCSQIIMADYLTSNRDEVKRFKNRDQDGYSWNHYFNFLGVLELNKNVDDIAERTRKAIKVSVSKPLKNILIDLLFQDVIYCDVTRTDVFGESHEAAAEFDVIIASLVFDVVAVSPKAFTKALKNVLQYLKQNGLIIIHGSIGEHMYTVGSAAFPAMEADEKMLFDIFKNCGLEVIKWELCVKISTHYYTIVKKT